MLWFTIWFMVILKIPALYLAYVIWWAVKDPPEAHGLAARASGGASPEEGGRGWGHRPRRRTGPRRGPHDSPQRRRGVRDVARSRARR